MAITFFDLGFFAIGLLMGWLLLENLLKEDASNELLAAELIAMILLGVFSSVLGAAYLDDMLAAYLVGLVLMLFARSIYRLYTAGEAQESEESPEATNKS